MSRTVQCVVLGIESEGLDRLPYPGDFVQRIFDNASKILWTRWLGHPSRLFNEYRLTPIEPKAREFLEREMEQFFFGEGSERPPDFVAEE